MGFFSWKCAVCGKSVPHEHSPKRGDETVFVTPDKVVRGIYNGYGEVSGVDIFAELGGGDRDRGIELDSEENDLVPPWRIKLVHGKCFRPPKPTMICLRQSGMRRKVGETEIE